MRILLAVHKSPLHLPSSFVHTAHRRHEGHNQKHFTPHSAASGFLEFKCQSAWLSQPRAGKCEVFLPPVMFLHVSVILSTGGGCLVRGGCLVPGGGLVWGGCGDHPRDGYCCGRNASYWNAFLSWCIFIHVCVPWKMLTLDIVPHIRCRSISHWLLLWPGGM